MIDHLTISCTLPNLGLSNPSCGRDLTVTDRPPQQCGQLAREFVEAEHRSGNQEGLTDEVLRVPQSNEGQLRNVVSGDGGNLGVA